MGETAPAETLEKYMVALGAVFDASEEAHGGVGVEIAIELHQVQVLDGDPSVDGSEIGPRTIIAPV